MAIHISEIQWSYDHVIYIVWYPMLLRWHHYIVRCRYNTDNFLKFPHNRLPIARPLGRDMGCLLWVSSLIHVLLLSVQGFIQNRDKLDCAITALDCILQWPFGVLAAVMTMSLSNKCISDVSVHVCNLCWCSGVMVLQSHRYYSFIEFNE